LLDNQWLVPIVVGLPLLALADVGFRLGRRHPSRDDQPRKDHISSLQAAVFSLLSLLVGFTFGMALDRYDKRRGLVIQEANAIETTWLRASLLPEAHRAPVRDLLRRYVDTRLKYQPLVGDPAMLAEGRRSGGELLDELWKHATQAAQEAPNDITAIFIESLNETVGLDKQRVAAMRGRIPGIAWFLLMSVAAFASFTVGFASGASGARSGLPSKVHVLMIAITIVLVVALAHPRRGFIGISQQALVDLQYSMRSE
jgi:hypothetical protein